MGSVYQWTLPGRPQTGSASGLHIQVVYTSPAATIASLVAAGAMARDLDARVSLLVPQVVPYPLALSSPPVSSDFTRAAMARLVSVCEGDIEVHILLCRDRVEAVLNHLAPASVVLVGRARTWGPGSYRSLIRKLRKSRHQVIPIRANAAQYTFTGRGASQSRTIL